MYIVQGSLRDNPTEEVYIAEDDNHLVGFVTIQVTYSFYTSRPVVEITGIFVRREYRKIGVASSLLEIVKKRCEEMNAIELLLRVNRNNHPALACYRKNGLAEADHYEYRIKYFD